MGYLSKGYYMICLSPILASVLLLIIGSLRVGKSFFVGMESVQLFFIGIAIPIIAIQAGGIALCLWGYRKNESMSFNQILNIFPVLWGTLVTLWAMGMYGELVNWASLVDASVTLWDHPEIVVFAALALIGLLWIASGLVFTYIYWRGSKNKE
jgi:hypothetical protein